MDKEFNLLDEAWIRVLDNQNMAREVSLITFFENAHCFRQLAGETVTQDVAIFRVLLAIVETVFYRYDSEGEQINILDYADPEEEVLERWKSYRKQERFNGNVFRKYLEQYRERFYLFHPETPFWQVKEISKEATKYGIINLYGNIKESNNASTRHHFHVRDGKSADNLSYAEATRWLIYNNAYSVNVKTRVDGENRATGVGRLGQLGLVMAEEENLFRMLLINLCALDGNGMVWGKPNPIWEQEIRIKPGREIVPPDNLPEIYTIQSRRLQLIRKDGKIIGFSSIGGDYYSTENDLREPMTLLQKREKEKVIIPKRHKKEVMSWREIPSILAESQEIIPGLVIWLKRLKRNKLLSGNKYITYRMIGLEYGDGMSYTNGEIISQSLTMSKELLEDIGGIWTIHINDEVQNCEKVVSSAFFTFSKFFSEQVFRGDTQKRKMLQETLASEYFFMIDSEFRSWLAGIDPQNDSVEEKRREWEGVSGMIANSVVERYISGLDTRGILTAAEAIRLFRISLYKIYPREKKGGRG